MLKTDIIAFGVRVLADNTNIVQKPDTFTEVFSTIMTGESYEYRYARRIEEVASEIATATKRAVTKIKFNRIVKNI